MSPAADTGAGRRTPIRVLVADPDAETRALYCSVLSGAGCDVVDVEDGRDALVKALSEPPSLLITETRLPMIDGYALCNVLRRDSLTHTLPIVVVTAETRPTQLERARAAGVDAVLTKPVTPDQLLDEIRRVLERPEPVAIPVEPPRRQRLSQCKAHLRMVTVSPPTVPPPLTCPSCDGQLSYEHSHVGGVSRRHLEQWDTYTCRMECGTFEYRQRTRKLRRVG